MFQRLRDLAPRFQLLLATASVVVIMAALLALWYGSRTPYATLLSRLRPSDAATIIAELDRRKLDYRLAEGGESILVPENKLDSDRIEILGSDLPQKGTVGFELFNKSDIGLTDFAQRINYQRALQGELERTISGLDGVEAVRVHLSMGESRVFRDDQVPPKASITIHMREGVVLADAVADGIERLVAAAVPQLTPEMVVIVDEEGRVIGQRAPIGTTTGIVPPLAEARQAISEYYEALARSELARRLPAVELAVSVRPLLSGEIDTSGDLPVWASGQRTLPLSVTVDPKMPLDDAIRDEVRSIVADAVNFNPVRGDSITFGAIGTENVGAAPSQPPMQPSLAAASDAPMKADVKEPRTVGLWVWLVAAILVGVVVWRTVDRPRIGLNASERADLVDRLKVALEREELDAAIG